jgi:hypothetical protein
VFNLNVPVFCPLKVPSTLFGHSLLSNFDEESIGATFKIVRLTVKELGVRDLANSRKNTGFEKPPTVSVKDI